MAALLPSDREETRAAWDRWRRYLTVDALVGIGGNLCTGLEDTFYLPDGRKARSNGELIDAVVGMARAAGRECATPAEARKMLHLTA